jgi:hypothetical protein
MNVEHLSISLPYQLSKQSRRSYTTEENLFILDCLKFFNIDNNKQKWIEIARLFKIRFPSIQPERTPKNLLDHFEHSLNNSLKRGPFTIEEHNFILNYISEKGRQWKIIGQILNRNENQVKNEFYRKLSTTKTEPEFDQIIMSDQFNFLNLKEEFDFESSFIEIINL